ncbi:MAG: sulfatase-like hydrolase/transferase [Planctomycetaceae bacterium]
MAFPGNAFASGAMSPKAALFAALALAAGGAILFWPGPEKRPPPPSPSVLIITLDTTRADAVGAGKGTPAIEAFLATARYFRDARTVAPLTFPAHTSLFTGLLPAKHAVHDNASPPIPTERDYTLLAEEFGRAGYATAGFTSSSVVGLHTALNTGFDVYEGPPPSQRFRQGQTEVHAGIRAAAARDWLAALPPGKPFFAWVHFFDPHWPYMPFSGDERRAATVMGDSERDRYLGEIRRVDAELERLLAAVPPGTIVVIATDHGESLGEHGEITHGPLCYGATLDILLAVRGPGMGPGTIEEGPRSLCDVAPTLRAWCGLPERPSDGVPLFRPARATVVSESLLTWRYHGWAQCFAASDGRFTLVESGPRVELFDRREDPGETRPLEEPALHEAYRRLDEALAALRASGPAPTPPEYVPDAATPYGTVRRPFSHFLTRPENAALADPVARMETWERLEAMRSRMAQYVEERDLEGLYGMVRELEEMVSGVPETPAVHSYLADAQRSLGMLLKSKTWSRAAMWSAKRCLESGYQVQSVLACLLEQGFAAGTAEDWTTALDAAVQSEVVADLSTAELAIHLGLALRASGDATALAKVHRLLDRIARHFPDEDVHRDLNALRAMLPE